jgi:hypothetical protein
MNVLGSAQATGGSQKETPMVVRKSPEEAP